MKLERRKVLYPGDNLHFGGAKRQLVDLISCIRLALMGIASL